MPPVPERVLEPDERGLSLRSAVTYVLRIPTNRRLIVASSLGYFYLTGVRTFAVPFLRGRFGIGQSLASTLLLCLGIGAVAGVLVAGRLADGLLERGHLDSRIALPASAYLLGAVVLLPGLLVGSLPMAMLLYVLGAALLTAANPPLDAARLDVIPSALWGRAESVRTVVRQTCQASAPLLFGVLAEGLGGPGTEKIAGPGLRYALLILLSALVLSSVVVWSARRAYPRDVATAAVSGRRPGRSDKP